MTPLQRLQLEQSEKREKLNTILALDAMTDEQRTDMTGLTERLTLLEPELRAAILASGETETRTDGVDAEMRERIELRKKASAGRYFAAAARGKLVSGAEAELVAAAKLPADAPEGAVPLELWDVPEARSEDRAISGSPATVGVNLDTLRPAVFAPSIASGLMIEMPMVGTGTYASGTIATSATADAVAKSGSSDANVPETAAAITVQTTTPHRVGAGLKLTLEDVASVGQQNFESLLRDHISIVLSDELDDQMINGAGASNDLTGIIKRLETIADPTDPTDVATFDAFVAAFADSIDGLWATQSNQVAMVAGVATYKLAVKAFRDRVIDTGSRGGVSLGAISFADYAMTHTAGFATNKRMPAPASNIQRAIVCRKGRSMMPSPMRTAVCPHWGYIGIDDIYSGARAGTRRYVISVLVGDLILVQPDAYTLREFKTA